jgi:hypothetical protein
MSNTFNKPLIFGGFLFASIGFVGFTVSNIYLGHYFQKKRNEEKEKESQHVLTDIYGENEEKEKESQHVLTDIYGENEEKEKESQHVLTDIYGENEEKEKESQHVLTDIYGENEEKEKESQHVLTDIYGEYLNNLPDDCVKLLNIYFEKQCHNNENMIILNFSKTKNLHLKAYDASRPHVSVTCLEMNKYSMIILEEEVSDNTCDFIISRYIGDLCVEVDEEFFIVGEDENRDISISFQTIAIGWESLHSNILCKIPEFMKNIESIVVRNDFKFSDDLFFECKNLKHEQKCEKCSIFSVL